MKDRIEQLLKSYQISSSKLADEIGVQRSSISHILTGRNNPSLDFIQKLLNKFRSINADWLIMGKGEMQKSQVTSDLFAQSLPPGNNTSNLQADSAQVSQTIKAGTVKEIQRDLRNVEKIIVFYDDKSFTEFTPSV